MTLARQRESATVGWPLKFGLYFEKHEKLLKSIDYAILAEHERLFTTCIKTRPHLPLVDV